MENKNQTYKIKNFYSRITAPYGSQKIVYKIILPIAIIVTIILSCCFVAYVGGIEEFKYPQTTYDYLENELEKVIINNTYIDMKQISDNSLSSKITYWKDEGNDNWHLCEIELSKSSEFVEGKITKTETGTLDMQVSHWSKAKYYFVNMIAAIVLIMITIACCYVMFYAPFYIIVWILMQVEWIILKIFKKTS